MRTYTVRVTVERKEVLEINTPAYATSTALRALAERKLGLKNSEEITRIYVTEERGK